LVPFVRTAQVCQLGLQPQRRHLPLISFNFFAILPLISLEKGETKRGLPQISTQKDYATSDITAGLCVLLNFPCTFPEI
jgi:hypothetical protein